MSALTDQRMERVVANLVPATAFDGKFAPTAAIAARQAYYHTPGVSIAVIDDYQVAWAAGFVVIETGSTVQVTPTTLFQAGSVSKPIFALAVMRLVQDGMLDLDEDVNRYLSSWRIPANEDWQPRITLRQLLSHSAGLTVHGFPGYNSKEALPSVVQILNGEAPANTPKVEVNIIPGLQFRYSGGGMTVAQQVLVDMLGKPFVDIMQELVLAPLGMSESSYAQPLPAERAEHAATGHPAKGIPLAGKWHCYPEIAAAGLWTTATDLAHAGVELMHVFTAKRSSRLLDKQTILEMLSPQLADQTAGKASSYYGLGFSCDGKDAGFHFHHNGWNQGFTAQMRFYPNLGKGAAIMVNSNQGYPMTDEVIRAIAREYQCPGIFPETKSPCSLKNLDDYTGNYVTSSGVPVEVSINEGHLQMQLANQPPLRLSPTSELEFTIPAPNARVSFARDDSTRINALTITQQWQQTKALKQ